MHLTSLHSESMRRRGRITLWIVLALIVALVALRVALPSIVQQTLNQRMDSMGAYHGHVDAVGLHLWRGAYSLDGLEIVKVSGSVPAPLLKTRRVDIKLSWHALAHGAIRASVDFQEPVLNFVDGRGEADSQAGTGVNWRAQLEQLVPIRLDEVKVHDGTITFRNFVSEPRVDLQATRVNATINNLTNADRSTQRRVAHMDASGRILGNAPVETSASFDPLGELDDFDFKLQVRDIQLIDFNDLARAYAKLDFASGNGTFVMELEASDGLLDGYAKPLFHDMKIFSWKQDVEDAHKNPLSLAWEALAHGVTSIFKNHEQNQFATRIPISGRIDDRKLGVWHAIVNVLHNAFVKAYTPQLEQLKPAPDREDS